MVVSKKRFVFAQVPEGGVKGGVKTFAVIVVLAHICHHLLFPGIDEVGVIGAYLP